MKKEVNLFAVAGIILLVILLIAAALILTRCSGNAPEPTEPSMTETEGTQPTETEEPTQEPTEPPHVHEYEETVTEPDCISGGYTVFTCACGDSYIGDETDALGHDWKDATCTDPKTCARCAAVEGRANGHQWDAGEVTTPATEDTEGEKRFTCTVCKATKTQAIPTLDHVHNYEETVEITPPTCTEDGFTTHTCRCGDSKVDSEVKALGHTMSEATCTKPEVCSVCGTTGKAALGHKWNPATCTEPMTCSVCGEKAGVPKGHKETTVKGKDATCTETGLTDGIQCSVCKTWIKEKEVIPAKGHKENTVKGKDPTCTETGLTDGIQCSVCNVWIKEQEIIPAKGHSEEIIKGYDSTCTETGLTDGKKCTVCQEWTLKQEVLQKKPHTEKTVAGYEPTCINNGLTDGIQCGVCKTWIKKQETIPEMGHKEETVKGKDSTCTETGLTDGIKCSVATCNAWIKEQKVIPAKGHKDFNWVVTKEETCTVDGCKERTCSRCSLHETEVIKAPGHKEEIIKGYAATYTTTGLTDGKKCTVCGTITVPQQTIPLLKATVTLEPGDGTVSPSTIQVTYGQKYGTLPTPTRTGYTSNGWKMGGKTITKDSIVEIVGNHTLVTSWTVNKYTVVYNANGGTGTTQASTHTYDNSRELSKNGFTRAGWVFLGWSTNASAKTAAYTDGQKVKNLTNVPNGTVTLYAIWLKTEYSIHDSGCNHNITNDNNNFIMTIYPGMDRETLKANGYTKLKLHFHFKGRATTFFTFNTPRLRIYSYTNVELYNGSHNAFEGSGGSWTWRDVYYDLDLNNAQTDGSFWTQWSTSGGNGDDGWCLDEYTITVTAVK